MAPPTASSCSRGSPSGSVAQSPFQAARRGTGVESRPLSCHTCSEDRGQINEPIPSLSFPSPPLTHFLSSPLPSPLLPSPSLLPFPPLLSLSVPLLSESLPPPQAKCKRMWATQRHVRRVSAQLMKAVTVQ